MHVSVEHRLICRFPITHNEIQPSRSRRGELSNHRCKPVRKTENCNTILTRHIEKIIGVLLRYDQRVARVDRILVEERNCRLAFCNDA